VGKRTGMRHRHQWSQGMEEKRPSDASNRTNVWHHLGYTRPEQLEMIGRVSTSWSPGDCSQKNGDGGPKYHGPHR